VGLDAAFAAAGESYNGGHIGVGHFHGLVQRLDNVGAARRQGVDRHAGADFADYEQVVLGDVQVVFLHALPR